MNDIKTYIGLNTAFIMTDRHGLSLSDVLLECKLNNIRINWIKFVDDALKHGWKKRTILSRIEEACIEVFCKDYSDIVIKKLIKIFIELR